MKHAKWVARAGAVLALAGGGLVAQAQAINTAWIVDSTGQSNAPSGSAPAAIGSLAPINLNTWAGSEANFAAASGATQTLRALAAGAGGVDGRFHMQSGGGFNWVSQVMAGTSNLNPGDPIRVSLDVHVDGSFDTRILPGTVPSSYHVNTLAYMSLNYGLYDMNAPGFDSENAPDLQFRYGGQATIEAGDVTWDASKVLLWSAQSAATATLQDGTPWTWGGNSSNGSLDHNLPPATRVSFAVNTGVLHFDFDTFVGNNLLLTGSFRAEAFGLNEGGLSWQALSDFANTFDVELVSSVPGVEFAGITPGVFQPVPEPATWVLLLGGCAALLRYRRPGRD